MRYVERNIWKKILPFLPGRSPNFFNYWRHFHWTKPRANPPKLHTPWSQNELDILDQLQHREGLSWEDMQHELPNRSKAAIEFELLRLWAGDEVWYGEGNNTLRSDNTLHSSEGLDSSPRSQINESKNTVDTPISPVTHLNTPSVSQTPTVYLISDEEDLEDAPTPDDEENVEDVPTPDDDEKDVEDAFTPIVDAEGVADTEAPNDQEEEKVAGLPSTPQHRRMPVFHTPNTKDRDLIDITWTMPGSRDSRRARRMLDYR